MCQHLAHQGVDALTPIRIASHRVGSAAAQTGVFVDQHHACARAGRGQRSRQPGRTAADHQHITKAVTLGRTDPRRPHVDPAQPRHAPEHALPKREKAPRIKRLVIEAHRQECAQTIQHACLVVAQATKRVHSLDFLIGGHRLHVGTHVRAAMDARRPAFHLHQRVRVVIRHGKDAARPVVLEAATKHRDPAGKQGAADGVAGKSAKGPPLETRLQRLGAVNPLTGLRWQSLHAAFLL